MRKSFLAAALLATLASASEAQQRECTREERIAGRCRPTDTTQVRLDSVPRAVSPAPAGERDTGVVAPTSSGTSGTTPAPIPSVQAGGAATPTPPRAPSPAGTVERYRGTTFYDRRLSNRLVYAGLIRNNGKFAGVTLHTRPAEVLAGVQKYYPVFGVEDLAGLDLLIRQSEVGECPSGLVDLAWVERGTGRIRYDGWRREMNKGANSGEKCLIKDGIAWASLLCGNLIVPSSPVAPPVRESPPARRDTLVLRTDSVFIERTVTLPPPPITIKVEDDGLPWGKIGIAAGIVGAGACAYYSDKFGYDWYDFKCFVTRQRTDVEVIHLSASSVGIRLPLP